MEVEKIIESNIDKNIQVLVDFAPTALAGLVVIISTFIFAKIFNIVVLKISKKSKLSKNYIKLLSRISNIIFAFIGIILLLNILGFKGLSTGVFASGGVVTVILGFALREIGENFCAGVLLNINKPFKIGDTIKSLDVEGQVKSIEIRYTHIRSVDGRDIYVPSSQIYKNTLINYTKDGLRRFHFNIGIDYSSDLKEACLVIDKALESVEGVLKDPEPGCVINNLLPGYIEIIAYFWVNVDNNISVRKIREGVAINIKDQLIAKGFILSNDTYSNHNVKIYNKNN